MKNSNIYDSVISEVLVFKTNVSSDDELAKVGDLLLTEKKITRWNIDRDDIDNVLRIECDQLQPWAVVKLLKDGGFECEELPD